MRVPRWTSTLLVVLLAIGAAAALATAVAGFVLTDVYRPHAPGVDLTGRPAYVRRSQSWSDRHLWAGRLVLLSSLGAALLALWQLVRARARVRPALVLGCAALAAAASAAALLTRAVVAWDQLALRAVTVGSDLSGYWPAAFGDGVLFVLVGGSELSQGEYGVVLIVHLAAPVIAAALLLGVIPLALRSRTDLAGDRARVSGAAPSLEGSPSA